MNFVQVTMVTKTLRKSVRKKYKFYPAQKRIYDNSNNNNNKYTESVYSIRTYNFIMSNKI